ncbi:MAG TPA: cupin domain-containing protein [Nocardioidaceae bacterium]|nr:cupin domain-containing protein [Nocardioidaceae bacterium]
MPPELAAASLEDPDEVREFPHGSMAVVEVGETVVGRVVFEPGWRWSEHVRATAGTDSCMVLHVGYILSGRLAVRMDDGHEAEVGPGEVFVVPPGHDGWVVGDDPCVMLDWAGGASYARPSAPRPGDSATDR